MKIFSCLGLVVFVLSLIPSTYQRLRPFHGSRATQLLDRLLSTTQHRNQRPHRKSSIEYGIRRKSGDEKTLRKPLRTHKLSTKGETTLVLSEEGKGRQLRGRARPNTARPPKAFKSASSNSASYNRDGKSARVEREYKRHHDERDLRNSRNPSKFAHARDKHSSVKPKKRRRKMFKKYGFIQAYVPQDQSQLPLSYQQLQQNDEAPQTGYLAVTAGDQTPNADLEQEGNSNAIPQFSDVQQAAYQSNAEQTAAFANSEESEQPQLEAEQLGAQQQEAYASQLSQQQGEEEEQQEAAANQEGQNQDQQGQDQVGLSQVGLNQEGLNQEVLTQNQGGQYQPQEVESQERQPGAGLVQGELQQNDAQQEAAQRGSEGQGISNSLASMFSLGSQAGQNPLGGEQRLAGFTGEGVATQQENSRDAAGPDATEQFQSSLEAALKEPEINGETSNSQGESQSMNIGGDSTHAINIGSDGATLSQDANEAETVPNNAALGNGRVTSPGSYQSAAVDDNGRPINAGGNNAGVNGYSPINGQNFNGAEGNFDGASQKEQQQPIIQSILEAANGHTRPAGATSPVQPMDDEVYKIVNIANANAPKHAKGCAGCPPHAKCIGKVCIINDDQPLAHILSALSGPEPSDDADEQNCSSCHYNAKCVNNDCVCKPGYTGDGYECRPDTCLPGCKDHGKCINGFCVCDHHHYFNGHSCSPYKISHQSCPSHCLKDCSEQCPPKCCAHDLKTQHLNNGTSGGALSDGHQVRPKPTNPHKTSDETTHHDNVTAVSQPSKAEGRPCPTSCETQCFDNCPEMCCKPCPANCTTKCHQSCPGHCCSPTEPARPLPSMKLQERFFHEMAEKFCPRACRKQCNPNTCPPICCESAGSPLLLFTDPQKNGKATGADVFKNALSWFGMMNLLNMMYDAYNNSTKAPVVSKFKSPMNGEEAIKQTGAASNGKDNAKDNFLLDPTGNAAKCLPSCSKICSPLCPPNCCTKAAAAKPVVQATQCPPTCKERCGAECSPSCCMLFITKPARPVTGISPGTHSPDVIRPVITPSTSALAPTHETQTAVQDPAITSANSTKTALSAPGAHLGCSSICPAYCYPSCSSSCCTGTAHSGGQGAAPVAQGSATAQVGQPLTAYPPAHPEPKPACHSQCNIWCGPMCPKQCCAAPPAPVSQPATRFATIEDKVGSTCPSGCDARCSPSCPVGCCAAAKLAVQGPRPPITTRSCAPQCARWCYPSCDKRCCKGANAPRYSNPVSCPPECRPYNCLSHCHHQCCLRNSAPSKSGSSQAAYAPRWPGLNLRRRLSNPRDRALGNYRLNTKITKLRSDVRYSLAHKSKRKSISRHH